MSFADLATLCCCATAYVLLISSSFTHYECVIPSLYLRYIRIICFRTSVSRWGMCGFCSVSAGYTHLCMCECVCVPFLFSFVRKLPLCVYWFDCTHHYYLSIDRFRRVITTNTHTHTRTITWWRTRAHTLPHTHAYKTNVTEIQLYSTKWHFLPHNFQIVAIIRKQRRAAK